MLDKSVLQRLMIRRECGDHVTTVDRWDIQPNTAEISLMCPTHKMVNKWVNKNKQEHQRVVDRDRLIPLGVDRD